MQKSHASGEAATSRLKSYQQQFKSILQQQAVESLYVPITDLKNTRTAPKKNTERRTSSVNRQSKNRKPETQNQQPLMTNQSMIQQVYQSSNQQVDFQVMNEKNSRVHPRLADQSKTSDSTQSQNLNPKVPKLAQGRVMSGNQREQLRTINTSSNSLVKEDIHLPRLSNVKAIPDGAQISQVLKRKNSKAKTGHPVLLSNKFIQDARYHKLFDGSEAQKQAQSAPAKEKVVLLSETEQKTFGNRCPLGYQKIKILGKGGIAVVWLGRDKSDRKVAMKQFPKQANKQVDTSAFVELQIQQIILRNSSVLEQENICMLLDSVEDKKDLWLIYELCPGKTMNEQLFDVKGEFYKGERIYMVHHGHFYHALRNNILLLKEFLIRMVDALNLFAKLSIVHADLKPDNILIDYDSENETILSLKIIDLGSSFLLNPEGHVVKSQQEFASSTPEYLPPEIQSFLSKRFTQQSNLRVEDFAEISFIFDVWSLGSILIEVLSGFPLWLSLKSRVQSVEGRSIVNYGLFGVAGRDNTKILLRQQQLLSNGFRSLMDTLKKGFDFSGQTWVSDKQFLDLFVSILCVNPGQRISPQEILEHPFFR